MIQDSPTEQARKAGPCGNWEGPEARLCYRRIARGCERMGRTKYVHLSHEHVQSMADLGSGHEERMKHRLHWMLTYGWITEADLEQTRNAERQEGSDVHT